MAAKPTRGAIAPSEPRIWASVLRGMQAPLAEQQLDLHDLLQDIGIEPEELQRTDSAIPFRKYLKFLEHAAEKAGDPLLGIRLASAAGAEALGAIGFLFLSSRTLIEALESLCHYMNLLQDNTHARVIRKTRETSFVYQLVHTHEVDSRQDVEFSLHLTARMIRIYAGRNASIKAFCFRHSPVAPRHRYESLLRAPVFFEQDANRIIIPSSTSHLSSHVVDPGLYPILKEFLDEELESFQAMRTFEDQVEHALYSRLVQPPITADKVARHLGVSRSTLFRRLAQTGVSFQQLLDRRNMELASAYLTGSDLGIIQIAHMVGFSEAASFSRAFSRWSGGSTPSAYRRQRANR